jgi:hypothetical protein
MFGKICGLIAKRWVKSMPMSIRVMWWGLALEYGVA